MHTIDNQFCTASTDGHRLSVAIIMLDQAVEAGQFGVIVPRKTIIELLKILKDNKNIHSNIEVFLSETKIKFKYNNIIFISKLIDGTFPEYVNFIPTQNENKLIINPKILAEAIDRVATVTVDKFRAVKFFIQAEYLEIKASGETRGTASEIIEYSDMEHSKCTYTGKHMTIGFNPKYLNDVLAAVRNQSVEIYLDNSQSPVLIKSTSHPKDSFVVMPVKV